MGVFTYSQEDGTPAGAMNDQGPEEVKEELPDDLPEIVPEPIPAEYISRIRNEFLSEAMAKDLINRAKQRKSRAEEEALLLIL